MPLSVNFPKGKCFLLNYAYSLADVQGEEAATVYIANPINPGGYPRSRSIGSGFYRRFRKIVNVI
jgi:hypothetical protein